MSASSWADRQTRAGYAAHVARRPSRAVPGLARQLAPFGVFFTGCYGALIVGGPMVGAALYVGAAGWALRGPFAIVQALTVSWLVTMMNPGLMESVPHGAILKLLVVAAAFARTLVDLLEQRATASLPVLGLLTLFCATVAVTSAFTSHAPDVSLFKIANFYACAFAVIVAMRMAVERGAPVGRWFLSLVLVTVFLGFALIASSLGYVRNDRGFQGLLNHPQAYGVFLAIAVAWLSAEVLFARRRHPLMLAGLTLALVSLLATQSRTAALAVAGAYALTFLIRIVVKGEVGRWWPVVLLGAGIVAAGLVIEPARQMVIDFVFKGGSDRYDSLRTAFAHSRGFVIEPSLQGFADSPIVGTGFGVASPGVPFTIERDPFLGLPISASVEKGFAFTALLEETGLVGTCLFLAFLAAYLGPSARDSRPVLLVGALAALFTNLGEGVLFSFGGMGLFMWLMLASFASYGNAALRVRSPGKLRWLH
jgi:O-antigen ligase